LRFRFEEVVKMENEIITRWAWKESGKFAEGHNIGALCNQLAEELFEDEAKLDASDEIRAAIFRFLSEESENNYSDGESPDDATYGYLELCGSECYWSCTNASFEWFGEEPDWWQDMIKQSDAE
jgi:hypothetical protein